MRIFYSYSRRKHYAPTGDFDEDLFGQIVESITVVSKNALRFCLAGGLALAERI